MKKGAVWARHCSGWRRGRHTPTSFLFLSGLLLTHSHTNSLLCQRALLTTDNSQHPVLFVWAHQQFSSKEKRQVAFFPLLDTDGKNMSNTLCVVGSVFGEFRSSLSLAAPLVMAKGLTPSFFLFQDPLRNSMVKQLLCHRVCRVSHSHWCVIFVPPFIRMWPLLRYEHGVCRGYHRLWHHPDHLHHHICLLPRHSSPKTERMRHHRWWLWMNLVIGRAIRLVLNFLLCVWPLKRFLKAEETCRRPYQRKKTQRWQTLPTR